MGTICWFVNKGSTWSSFHCNHINFFWEGIITLMLCCFEVTTAMLSAFDKLEECSSLAVWFCFRCIHTGTIIMYYCGSLCIHGVCGFAILPCTSGLVNWFKSWGSSLDRSRMVELFFFIFFFEIIIVHFHCVYYASQSQVSFYLWKREWLQKGSFQVLIVSFRVTDI